MGSLKIWTIGHGTRPVEELASMLGSAGVELLIDVRAHPGSRRHPQFNRVALESSLGRGRPTRLSGGAQPGLDVG